MLVSLDILPKKATRTHEWADFVEFHCIVTRDDEFTQSDLMRLIDSEKDFSVDSDDDNTEASIKLDEHDELIRKVEDVFNYLDARAGEYGEKYPFILSGNAKIISFKNGLTGEQRLYMFLLVCSNTRFLEKKRNSFTSRFEYVCFQVLKKIIPIGGECYLFGAATNQRYSGNIFNRVTQLTSDLNGVMVSDQDDFNPNATGDEGLDIVAWLPSGDDLGNRLVFFAQCACSMDAWKAKQKEASYERQSKNISFSAKNVNIMFVPFSNRKASGRFEIKPDMDVVFFDRYRIMHKSESCLGDIELGDCDGLINKIIEFNRTIV